MTEIYVSPVSGKPYICQSHMDESVIDRNGQCMTCREDEHEAELMAR